MAFLASNSIPARSYDSAKFEAIRAKTYAQQVVAALQSNVNAEQVVGIVRKLDQHKIQLNSYRTVDGIVEYAQDQESDPTYDVAAEFLAVIAALDTAINWVITNYPTDASGYLLERQWNGTALEYRVFTPAMTGGLTIALQAFIATVD